MTDSRQNPFEKGQLRMEATEWFVVMRGPEAEERRAEFEQWLARGALHRAAYNRVANLYSAAKQVNWDAVPKARPVRGSIRRAHFAVLAAITVVGFVTWRMVMGPDTEGPATEGSRLVATASPAVAAYRTGVGELRNVRLSDGSRLTLDASTLVLVDYGRERRALRLEYGRARFDVAHERRPFAVDAGTSQVLARGTVFDVSLDRTNRIEIHLLRGSVDVTSQGRDGVAHVMRLQPGEALRFQDQGPAGKPTSIPDGAEQWTSVMMDFRSARLAEVLEAANRSNTVPIELGGEALRELRVSGSFRVDNPDELAQSLAAILDLRVRKRDGAIFLSAPEK